MRGLQYARTRRALSCWRVLAKAINGPEWLPHGVGPESPPDQLSKGSGSLVFGSDLLESELIVCGAVSLALSEGVAVDGEVSVTADRDNFHIKGEYGLAQAAR